MPTDPAPRDWSRAESLFARWLEASGFETTADVEALCRAHPAVASELRALSAHWRELQRELEPLGRHGASAAADAREAGGSGGPGRGPGSSAVWQRLDARRPAGGRYRVQEEIARGGMGAILKIWDEDLGRDLAMKVILGQAPQAGGDSAPPVEPRAFARFLEEAQITGRLDHPGIVPVHELGLDSEGRAYFTMKLVQGRDLKAIFERVRENGEGWSETRALGVMLKVCEALSYAHAKGVIHRDLKPANVMVGSFGEVYVMDWGLARATGREDLHDVRLAPRERTREPSPADPARARDASAGSPLQTMDGVVLGTPAYMPPEQARSEVERLSPRSDVYAVGAMLYHLLGRRVPYAAAEANAAPHAVLARVLAGPPQPLAELRPDLPPELVAIVERAMAREPEDRYADTAGLARDLSAYLEHRVVGAYETGTWAETRKWVQRNKPLAASLAASLLVLAAGLAGTWTQARRADAKSAEALGHLEEARRRAAETKLVAGFQTRMLSDLSVDEFGHALVGELRAETRSGLERLGHGEAEISAALEAFDRVVAPANATNVAVRTLSKTLFEPAVDVIDRQYAGEPLVQAMLQTSLAGPMKRLRLDELGVRAARAAVETRRRRLGDADPETLTAVHSLATLLRGQGRLAEAEPLAREALAGQRANLGDDHPETLTCLNELAVLLQARGQLAEAEPLHRLALERRRAVLGDDHPDTLLSVNNLALLLDDRGETAQAEALHREALAGRRAVLGDDHPDTLASIHNLAVVLEARGEHAEAEPLYREALAGSRAKLGDLHPSTLSAIENLAFLLQERGELGGAEPLYREASAGRRARLGPEHPETLNSAQGLAHLLRALGRLAEAEPLYREALAGRRAKLGPRHPSTLLSVHGLAELLRAEGKLDEAEPLAREALEGCRAQLGPRHRDTLATVLGLAELLRARGKPAEAEPLAREALAGLRASFGDDHPSTLAALDGLARLLHDQGRLAEAEPLYRAALEGYRAKLGDAHPSTLSSVNNLGVLLRALGRHAEAEPLYREALEGYRAKLGDEHPSTLTALGNLAVLLQSRGGLSEAETLYREVLAKRRAKLGDEHPETLLSVDRLASLLRTQGRLAEAEPLLLEALAGRRLELGRDHARTREALDAVLAVYASLHQRDPSAGFDRKADELRREFP